MVWDKAKIHALLDAKPRAVERALLALYARQLPDERTGQQSRHTNGVGFSKFDAPFCSDLAEKIKKGWTLSPKQLAVARNKCKRYHRQLVEIANEQEAAKVPAIQPAVPAPATPERLAQVQVVRNRLAAGVTPGAFS